MSPSDQWSMPFTVPDACVASELPPDAHILPAAAAINSAPPAALVSLGTQYSLLQRTGEKGLREGKLMLNTVFAPVFVALGLNAREM